MTADTERALTAEQRRVRDVRDKIAAHVGEDYPLLALLVDLEDALLDAERAARAEPGLPSVDELAISLGRWYDPANEAWHIGDGEQRMAAWLLNDIRSRRAALEAHGEPQEGER